MGDPTMHRASFGHVSAAHQFDGRDGPDRECHFHTRRRLFPFAIPALLREGESKGLENNHDGLWPRRHAGPAGRTHHGAAGGTGWPEMDKGKVISFPKRRRASYWRFGSPCESGRLVAGVRFELTTFGL